MSITATEGKPEAKVKAEVKEKEDEKNQENVEWKTHVLRVSIHCEHCRRKVKKILANTKGVYTTNIDLKQQKVIVTGDVDSETLIRKLEKKGKHAELWPESKTEQKDQKQSKPKNKEKQQKQSDQEITEEINNQPPPSSSSSSGKERVKVEAAVQESSINKEIENGGTGTNGKNVNEVGSTSKAGGQVKESKPEVKQTETLTAGTQSSVGDNKVSSIEKNGGGGGDGSGGKKKKKQGQKGNSITSGKSPAGTGSPIHGPHGENTGPNTSPTNYSPPRQHWDQYPQYPPPPQHHHHHTTPVYAVSYNTAYPRPSYTTSTSYYTPPAPYSYASMHPGTGSELPPSDMYSYSSQPSDSFEIFSEENPNACSIM